MLYLGAELVLMLVTMYVMGRVEGTPNEPPEWILYFVMAFLWPATLLGYCLVWAAKKGASHRYTT